MKTWKAKICKYIWTAVRLMGCPKRVVCGHSSGNYLEPGRTNSSKLHNELGKTWVTRG